MFLIHNYNRSAVGTPVTRRPPHRPGRAGGTVGWKHLLEVTGHLADTTWRLCLLRRGFNAVPLLKCSDLFRDGNKLLLEFRVFRIVCFRFDMSCKSLKVGESAPCDYYIVADSGGMEYGKQLSANERFLHDEVNLR